MSARLAAAFAGMALAAVSCGELADVQSNVCGNRVIEQGETCDGEPEGACLPPGAAGQCHFDCTIREDGTRPECPAGSGCDATGVCREATGGYVARSSAVADNATSVLAADFDGDGRAEVLSQEAITAFGATKFRVHYFDREGAVTQSWNSVRPAIAISVGQVSDDPNYDVVLSDGRIGVLLGQPDRTLISETYPSYFLPDTKLRVAGPLFDGPIGDTAPLLIVSEQPNGLVLRHPDTATSSLLEAGSVPAQHIDELAGEPEPARLFDADPSDPCNQVALAVRGASEVHVYSLCTSGSPTPGWLPAARDRALALEPPAPITSGPLVADVDGNGHLDLAVGTEQHAYIALGDGSSLAAARPWTVRTAADAEPVAVDLPLAMGDVTGDGRADLVYPEGLLISQSGLDGSLEYRATNHSFGVSWTAARVADFNANGLLDVVAVSDTTLDIDFYNGTGRDALNPAVIPTQHPVRQLAVGDFDGDLVLDLAYTQSAGPSELSEVMVSFGNAAGPPMPGITAARAPSLQQIGALEYEFDDRASELFLVYEPPATDGSEGAAFAWLSGFSRRLMCLVELNRFVEGLSVESMPSLGVALGTFTDSGGRDAMALASPDLTSDQLSLWIVPDLASRTSQPAYLGWNLDPESKPVQIGTSDGEPYQLDMLMGAGDLDGSGKDELVFAAPTPDRERCRVSIVHVSPEAEEPLQSEVALTLGLPCSQARGGQLALRDLDGDSALDLTLLSGFAGQARELRVFWNDGSGHFSVDESSDLARDGDQPAAFALYRPTPGDRLRLAYVTADRLRIFQASTRRRGFEAASGVAEVIELEGATGVTAGDVDGDQIADLVVAESGNVVVFRAQLRP